MSCKECGSGGLYDTVHKVLTIATLGAGLYYALRSHKETQNLVLNFEEKAADAVANAIKKGGPVVEAVKRHVSETASKGQDLASSIVESVSGKKSEETLDLGDENV